MASTTDWVTVISSILAGGLAGQLVTIFGGYKITEKHEHKKWLKKEKYNLFNEFLALVTNTPKTEQKLNDWTYEIREISQKIHLLSTDGTAPEALSAAIETVFRLAQQKKDNTHSQNWDQEMRDSIRVLRKEMAHMLDC